MIGNTSEDRSGMAPPTSQYSSWQGHQSSPSRVVLEIEARLVWGEIGGWGELCIEFLRNLHNPPRFQEPVRKEVMATQGNKVSHSETLAQPPSTHRLCVSSIGPWPPEGERTRLQSPSPFYFQSCSLKKVCPPSSLEAILAVGSCSCTRTVAHLRAHCPGSSALSPWSPPLGHLTWKTRVHF